MGYTCGRVLDPCTLANIARKYKSRSEFQKYDGSAYATANRQGLLDAISKHMKCVSFSIPQLICRDIIDRLLGEVSKYNTRKVIPPYEIDIYYPKLSLAIEYNGKGWHCNESTLRRDKAKRLLLQQKEIFLIEIHENSRDYETDIKTQLKQCDYLKEKFRISNEMIDAVNVNWNRVYEATTLEQKINEIKIKVASVNTLKQFREQFKSDYQFVCRYRLLYLLKTLDKQYVEYSDAELLDIARTFSTYKDFIESKYYQSCHRRNLLGAVSKILPRRMSWKGISDAEIINMGRSYLFAIDCKMANIHLFTEIKHRRLKVWHSRKCKIDPQTAFHTITTLRQKGVKWQEIKSSYKAFYRSYLFHKQKGRYLVKEKEK